ncbi:MAG: LuxR C-terminal-related transcriptional regulator, partial [Sciscionella sp.]
FSLLGQVHARTCQVPTVVDAEPDVVLVDDLDCSAEVVELIGEIKRLRPSIAAIVLTMSMDPEWLDALFEAGAAGAISKATHPAVLATLVRETIDGNFVHVHKSIEGRGRSASGASASAVGLPLTRRELEVLALVAGGATNSEIARRLWVTEQTVKFHLSNVYRKLKVENRTEASHYAHVNGLVGAVRPSEVF